MMSSLPEGSVRQADPAQAGTSSSSPLRPSPIESYHQQRSILGHHTELLIQSFDDRILVMLTQNGKVGCLTQASLPQVTPLPPPRRPAPSSSTTADDAKPIMLPPPPDAIHLTPLLGTPPRPTLYSLYTSQIATLIWWTLQELSLPRRPVVVGLALEKTAQKRVSSASGSGGEEAVSVGSVGDEEELHEEERERFMDMVDMVVAWPGPGGGAANDILDPD